MFYVQYDNENKILYQGILKHSEWLYTFNLLSPASVFFFFTLLWRCNEMSIHLNILLDTKNTVLREIKAYGGSLVRNNI